MWESFLQMYLVDSGIGWAMIGGVAAVMFGGIGSAQGIRIAAGQSAGVLSEKPELFGKLLALMSLPGTQGIYGFVTLFMIMVNAKVFAGNLTLPPMNGMVMLFIGIGTGVVLWRSAVYQGETSAASISLTAKKPDQFGRAIILPALVEFYALVAVVAAILLLNYIKVGTTT